ncbi:MAG: excinuclease ABC subunit UvrC [Betaproteobacteria bacterium]|nr:MAG: excinuclease ABC subunit UvrC [Betaproteobacteria bacterium]
MIELSAFIAGLPHQPGVYRMLSATGEALYVGKALDLKKRVASYFQKPPQSPRIQLMLSQVAAIETTVTRSEAEALLLENNLIKSLSPRYNILFKDDKSYPYLMLSGHRFPRLGFHRGPLDRRHRYFGPFPNAGAVRESIQLLQKVFRVRTCEDTVFANRSRPCLLHQIRRCTAPCMGWVTESAYAEDVNSAEMFLSGREDAVVARLEQRMNAASARTDYEEAAVYRDQIAALRKVQERQFVSGEGEDTDIIACGRAAGIVCVNLTMIRGGHHLGDKNFFPRNADDCALEQILEAFMLQHYLQHVPPLHIVVATAPTASLNKLLSERAQRKVSVHARPTGVRKAWLQMVEHNAQLGAEQALGRQANQEARLNALQQALELPDTVQRIECFDISHTMGEATVASCVVYDHSTMQKSDYRRFNITDIAPGDDYGAMREVLSRRYRRIVSGEGRLPDLVLIDGGKGQLAVANEVFAELGLTDVAVAAVAKGEERRPGEERLLLPQRPVPIVLGSGHPGLHLVQQIRDEAHRFAIEGHRARRGKPRAGSTLEGIAGIGAKRRQRLLSRFGGLRGLLSASIDDLTQVEGISRTLAEKIYHELH